MTNTFLNAAVFFIALVGMEGVAWLTHRYVMHGALWTLHESHHQPRTGTFERNDLFGLAFSGLAICLFYLGTHPGWTPAWWAGLGMTSYGVLYALVHDGLVHRRWHIPLRAENGYLKQLVQAHRLHHATRTKVGAVSFGFLIPGNVRRLSMDLRSRRRIGRRCGTNPGGT